MSNGVRTAGAVVFLIVTAMVSAGHGAALFHTGTGSCDGCHGRQTGAGQAATGSMLIGSDAGSTCLLCHEGPAAGPGEQYHVSTPPAVMGPGIPPRQLTPGGDFGWLKKSYWWTDRENGASGGEEASPGERHGHNIVARDFGYVGDRTHLHAPGGIFPVDALSCVSCHNPHGASRAVEGFTSVRQPSGSYRMLGGAGYRPKNDPSIPAFTADAPAAIAPRVYNRSEAAGDTRVAYGRGMSEWCRNCHTSVHSGAGFGHPAGAEAVLGGRIAANYNSYVASGDLSGSWSSSYSSLVPYEMVTDEHAVMEGAAHASGAASSGPDPGTTANVMCLTCHRAHASGWDSMTRWNTGATFIVANGRYPGTDDPESSRFAQGRTTLETRAGYYDRRPGAFAPFQRSLCNKCHPRD
ncbi:cytochrome C [Geobacter sp. DSM 9736]|uniref:cytochrome C n=1 Tax=Geobacter sp. DSM 9736 TaxID=1277350 RepID=UPI0012FDB047|nr:cytochrome C [Geobacter sp. DSM 9736]